MSGTRGGLARLVAIGIWLVVALLLLFAREARAGFYSVAQCGWGVGADADWWDSTGGAKFRSDAYCAGGDGDHLKSFGREGAGTVSGERFARWRWVAPPTTGIRAIRGSWWQALHDGFEQRLGGATVAGAFSPFLASAATDATPREFGNVFTPSVEAVEDRLLCARGDDRWCALDPGSWSGLRALTITIDDGVAPGAWITGGDLTDGGWRHGSQLVAVAGYDAGSGVRFGETLLDGGRVGGDAYPCEQALIDGEWRGTRMQPCLTNVSSTQTVDTGRFSDGPHVLAHCTADFAGNVACAPQRTVLIDNNPPAQPQGLGVVGGEGWRRIDDFDLAWVDPDQGPASPIGGAFWRVTGPAGYDSGVHFEAGHGLAALADRSVPAPGLYSLHLWLRDDAGNDAPSAAAEVPLRFDDVPPGLAFAGDDADAEQVRATVTDAHSGPAAGAISCRRLNAGEWTELATKRDAESAERMTLVARLPELAPGTYVFRADAADGAGNVASTTLRADGTEMALRRTPPAVAPARPANPAGPAPRRGRARLFARLRGGHGRGDALTVPFAAPALLGGRLTRADGAGVSGRELRVLARPSHGALAPTARETATTGERGGFELRLPPGPSRRIAVVFPGDDGFEPARRAPLELRVRSGISLAAAPLSLRTGAVVHLSGRVRARGAAIPRRGKLIAIQYLEAATGRWRPVLVTRSDHGGRFRARYRFRYVSGVASIRLRATALAEERWPYAPGSSSPIAVRVRGR
jgi:hypothetical protein